MENDEFLSELRQLVLIRARSEHLVDTLAFVSEVAERLQEDPVFGEFSRIEFSGVGQRNAHFRIHGYTELDEADGTLGLVIAKWSDAERSETLNSATVNQLTGALENFLREALRNNLYERITESNKAHEVAEILANRKATINRIRLHILSNQVLSQRYKEDNLGNVLGIALERHVWDLTRLKAIYESSREREAVEIDLADFGVPGIPCIQAAKDDNWRSYLCVIQGPLLADMFERYGSRLLEGNVRSFLGMKGGVNRKIRSTIQDNPSLFFAYNNGIAATAADVKIERVDGSSVITKIVDLQIVNGGQTTASVLNARKKEKLSLDAVSVPMKLTQVRPENANDLIPRIAEYANTQNKVAAADFFANHPFHRKMEEISRRVQVPAKAGERILSKWFYERSRGQYQNERLYLTKAKKDAFDLEYPSRQVINKTDLAKFDSAWGGKPHWVSLGAQKNFTRFAGKFSTEKGEVSESEYWESISPKFGEQYYQRIVAISILWKCLEEIVSSGRGTWYQGDYRPQIVAYALSLFADCFRREGVEFDLNKVWMLQDVDDGVSEDLRNLAIEVQKILLSPPAGMTNVGEWSKKEACWNAIRSMPLPRIQSLDNWKVEQEEFRRNAREERKRGAQDDGIAAQARVLELVQGGYWNVLTTWSKYASVLSEADRKLVERARTIQGFSKIALEKDWRRLLDIRRQCEDEGFRHK